MLKKYSFKKRTGSIFTSWLASYFAILLIPVAISALVYFETTNVIKNEINRANMSILKQASQVIDNNIREIENFGMELSLKDNIQSLLYVKKPLENTDRYVIRDTVYNDMALTGSVNGLFKSLYIYFKYGDFVIRPSAYYEPEVAYSDFHQNSNLTYNEWYGMMQGNYYKTCLPVGVNNEYSSSGSTIAYLKSFPMGNNPGANIVFLLNENYFNEIIQGMEWIKRGNFYIIDKDRRNLASSGVESLATDLEYESLNNSSDIFYKEIDNEKYVISYITSKVMDWKYISVLPEHVFMEKAAYARKITIIGLIACMLLGAVVAYVFARKNYNPVNEIIASLKNKINPDSTKSKNEFQFIREAIYNTLLEKEEIGRKLELQKQEMCAGFLVRLLRGRVNRMGIDEKLSSYGIDFSTGRFSVMLFDIEDYSGFFKDENLEHEEEKVSLVEFAIKNVVEELARKSHGCQMVEVNGMIACIINLRGVDIEQGKKDLLGIAREAKEFTRDSLYIILTISISSIYDTVLDITHAYHEALEALEYKMVLGSGEIICYDEIKKSSGILNYSIEMEIQLINNIKTGNLEKSMNIINNIFINNFKGHPISLEMVRCLMFDLTSTIVKTLNELNGSFDESIWQEINPVKLLSMKTVPEMRRGMEEILIKVCSYVDGQKESHNVKLKDDIIKHIADNYFDMNLGNASIADKFGVNAAYLSRFFKEQTGEGILDYINRIRLEKAKALLKEENLNIGEIANKVGYYNNVALIRAFKKYEGITPGKYKESCQG